MDKTEKLRQTLAQVIMDNMGKEAGQLFYDFHKYEKKDSVILGARGLLYPLMGPRTAEKVIQEAIKTL